MTKPHVFTVSVRWAGNHGDGTSSYRAYSRNHELHANGKPTIPGSSDAAFRGDASRWNPEELFVASLSACHKLWYLHLCAQAGVNVQAYEDHAAGTLVIDDRGSGQFSTVELRPRVTITADSDMQRAVELHHEAHEMCFIANSVKTTVTCEPQVTQR